MKVQVRYLNPAGNITAVVLSSVLPELRPALSRAIMAQRRAEQVGFAATPRLGGDCRVEMMGGEFCGNAVRSYGYLRADGTENNRLAVEISGATAPVPVTVNSAQQSAPPPKALPRINRIFMGMLQIAASPFSLLKQACRPYENQPAAYTQKPPGLIYSPGSLL